MNIEKVSKLVGIGTLAKFFQKMLQSSVALSFVAL